MSGLGLAKLLLSPVQFHSSVIGLRLGLETNEIENKPIG